MLQVQQQQHEAELAREAADGQRIGALVSLAQEVAAMCDALRSALPGLQIEPEEGPSDQAASSSTCCCASTEDAHALLMLQAWPHLIPPCNAAAFLTLSPDDHEQCAEPEHPQKECNCRPKGGCMPVPICRWTAWGAWCSEWCCSTSTSHTACALLQARLLAQRRGASLSPGSWKLMTWSAQHTPRALAWRLPAHACSRRFWAC